jgi:hypothetical protein
LFVCVCACVCACVCVCVHLFRQRSDPFQLNTIVNTHKMAGGIQGAFWRQAGITYLQYLAISSRALRGALKVRLCLDGLIWCGGVDLVMSYRVSPALLFVWVWWLW